MAQGFQRDHPPTWELTLVQTRQISNPKSFYEINLQNILKFFTFFLNIVMPPNNIKSKNENEFYVEINTVFVPNRRFSPSFS